MQFRRFRLKFRKRLMRGQQQVEGFSQQAEANLDKHFFRRLSRLSVVWRFITAWLLLFVVLAGCLVVQLQGLSGHYQVVRPMAGGTFTEGVLGTFTNANPLFARGLVNETVSHLVFAGLFTYDSQNHLVGNLARGYDVDARGTTYTVHLKPNLTWQDGQRLTADDVVFTYHTIQNPDVQSPLASGWDGIAVAKKDAYTVTFTLPNPLGSFPYTLTNGIVPAHLLDHVAASDLRSNDFNTIHPVGSGPFEWSALQVENSEPAHARVLIALKPFAGYVGGQPKLEGFVVSTYANQEQLVAAFRKQKVDSLVGLSSPPSDLSSNMNVQHYDPLLTAETMTFFNTTSPVMNDAAVRRSLVQATDTAAIRSKLGYTTRAVDEPLLPGQLGYDRTYRQSGYDVAAAKAGLDKAGWITGHDGVRSKGVLVLEVNLYAANTPENSLVTHLLRHYWQAVGAKVQLHLLGDQDLQSAVNSHDYDALLYGISIGVDPDVFVYWDSSQTDPRSTRLNLSLYKSAAADASLEAGRTRLDPSLRIIKYRPFLQAWQQDAPALALYQPRFVYITDKKLYGFDAKVLNTPADRLNQVQAWEFRTAKVTD